MLGSRLRRVATVSSWATAVRCSSESNSGVLIVDVVMVVAPRSGTGTFLTAPACSGTLVVLVLAGGGRPATARGVRIGRRRAGYGRDRVRLRLVCPVPAPS